MAQASVKARSPRREPVLGERFSVFAECLLTGVWIAVACLGLVTYPAAFAAGARHLRRRTAHVAGGWREFLADFRAALRGGWFVGLAGWAAAAAVWVDVQAARAGLPGGPLVGAVGLLALIAAAVAGLRAAATWTPGAAWRSLLRAAGRRTVLDPAGSFLLVAGVAVVACSGWFSPPLAVPVLGAVAAAAVAVEERYRHR
ncbi:Integral membrane protein OS=Streptomyces glaucescens OX=1907 GN=SGLAU_06225 PE=4 SV=1 [Streptomyces glaucescens]